MATGFAEFDALADHLADAEPLAAVGRSVRRDSRTNGPLTDEVVQCSVAGRDVPAVSERTAFANVEGRALASPSEVFPIAEVDAGLRSTLLGGRFEGFGLNEREVRATAGRRPASRRALPVNVAPK